MFNNLGQFADLMKNASKLRESMEQAVGALQDVRVEGSAGGGAVVAVASGKLELISLRIDPKLAEEGDFELLEELVLAAVNQALAKAREAATGLLSSAAGNLPPQGLTGLFGQGV